MTHPEETARRLEALDQSLIWHPFTQEQTANRPLLMARGEGAYLYDANDHSYLDLISSWWVNLHGHGHPAIAQAIFDQARRLEHVIFAGCTHENAILLCQALKLHVPACLSRFFFSDNGSTAVEVALKMAHQYWHNKGHTKRRLFLSLEGAYHGDTFGAMAASKKSGFFDPFLSLFFETLSIPYPDTSRSDTTLDAREDAALLFLQHTLDERGSEIASLILEPLVQGASGMRCARASFINKVIEKVRAYDILVIFDEVMTGFYRTGTFLASDQITHKPDFLCLSKGITGGFLPLAVTLTTDAIYQAFLDHSFNKAFAHGHSYTANPLACAAARASLDLLMQPKTQSAIKTLCATQAEGITFLENEVPQLLLKPRTHGTIAAFDLANMASVKEQLKTAFLQQGLLLRPLHNTLYLIPPYVVTKAELEKAYHIIADVLKLVVLKKSA